MFSYLIDKYFVKQPKFRRALTALIEQDRVLRVNLTGSELTINSRREHGYLRASRFIARSSALRDELPILINLATLVNDQTTVVDVGANVGLYTHTFRRLRAIYPALSVVAIEANPDTFARLSAVAYDGVTFWNLAASDHDGVLTFCDGAVSHVFTTIDSTSAYNISSETVEVKARRLDSLSLLGNELLLKIDVEGQEMSVLQGASALFSANRIATVYVDGFSNQAIPEFLRERGFRLRNGRSLEAFRESDFSLLATRIHPAA